MKQFKEKVAVITGAASGIGRALADRCANEGMKVVLVDIEEQALTQAREELEAAGANVLAVQTDVSKRDDINTLAIERAIKRKVATFISGGALGVDQWTADIVLDMKAEEIKESYGRHSDIKLIIAQPFPSQSSKWPQEARRRYDKMLQKAERIIAVSNDPYSPAKIQKRNEWIVDNSDAMISVWDGSSGWVVNTVNYAEGNDKPVLMIDPKEESERWIISRKDGIDKV